MTIAEFLEFGIDMTLFTAIACFRSRRFRKPHKIKSQGHKHDGQANPNVSHQDQEHARAQPRGGNDKNNFSDQSPPPAYDDIEDLDI